MELSEDKIRKNKVYFFSLNTFNKISGTRWSSTKFSHSLYFIQGGTFDELLTIVFVFPFCGFKNHIRFTFLI